MSTVVSEPSTSENAKRGSQRRQRHARRRTNAEGAPDGQDPPAPPRGPRRGRGHGQAGRGRGGARSRWMPPGWTGRPWPRPTGPARPQRAVRPVRLLLSHVKPQALANTDVRSCNKPLCNGPRTVPNWTSGSSEASSIAPAVPSSNSSSGLRRMVERALNREIARIQVDTALRPSNRSA